MTLEDRIQLMVIESPHLETDDNLLVANVYAELYPNRYAFNQFLYDLASGKAPSQNTIIQIKNQYLDELKNDQHD